MTQITLLRPNSLCVKISTLRRVTEYIVVGLTTKITVELENLYKDKLLSVADGSLDGLYRRWFMGKGMYGGTGYKVPDANECSMLLSTVEKFNKNVFKAGSLSQSNQR